MNDVCVHEERILVSVNADKLLIDPRRRLNIYTDTSRRNDCASNFVKHYRLET